MRRHNPFQIKESFNVNPQTSFGAEMSKSNVMRDISMKMVAETEAGSVSRLSAVAKLARHSGMTVFQPEDGNLHSIGFMSMEAGGDELAQQFVELLSEPNPFPHLRAHA